MAKVITMMVVVWGIIIASLIIMAGMSDGVNDIAFQAAAEIAASGNMSQQPGILEAVNSFPVWKWAIPPVVGIVISGGILYKNRAEVFNR